MPQPNYVHAPVLVRAPEASYTNEARRKNLDGNCLISAIVDTKGRPRQVRVIRCSDSVFAKSALASVREYRFKPATLATGKPVSAKVSVEIKFRLYPGQALARGVQYAISTPPGTTSSDPDSDGVYPLTGIIKPPVMKKFSEHGYVAGSYLHGGSVCKLLLTVDAKGNPHDAQVMSCSQPNLEKPSIDSLMHSQFTPGLLNGKKVPVRVLIRLSFKLPSEGRK